MKSMMATATGSASALASGAAFVQSGYVVDGRLLDADPAGRPRWRGRLGHLAKAQMTQARCGLHRSVGRWVAGSQTCALNF
jgi:hypothetical protein